MNYIALIQGFWRLHAQEHLTGNQAQLYFFLLEEFNKEGEGSNWPEVIRISDGQLSALIGHSPNNMKKHREQLENRGLIQVQTTGRGGRSGAEYRLINHPNSSKRISKRISKNDEVEEEIHQKDSQKDNQKECQKDSQNDNQNLTNSYNIDESKLPNIPNPLKPPNPQTKKGGGEGEIDSDFSQKKTGETGPPPTPSQPAGRVINRDPFLFKSESEKTNVPFSQWYRAYDKNINEDYCRVLWLELSDEQRLLAMEHTPPFVQSTPYKGKRPHPQNYLANKGFNDEIIDRHEHTQNSKRSGSRIQVREESTSADDFRSGFNRRRQDISDD